MGRKVAPSKRGKTARHYAKNAASRKKHVKDNSPGGKYAHSKEYKRVHAKKRASLKCKKNQDVVKKKGKWSCESLKINRRRGGAKRK
tara:strand:+ start:128 stop:388 length:261 start_codon:yes stop_codon:yes gene_type:complete